ncbi:hypothetical protein ACTHGU_07625 [Chitinophagaceae bacterium MMS25-I14]
MNWKQTKAQVKYYAQYIPFTLNTVVYAIAVWLAFRLLYQPAPDPKAAEMDTDSFRPIIMLMGKVALWFVVALVALSVLTTIGGWLYYLWLRHKKDYKLAVRFVNEAKPGKKNRMYIETQLDGALRPVLGFVTGRLVYDDGRMTGKFGLQSDKRKENSIWRAAITGRSRMELPDIREYELRGGFIFFEDMLHLFSLAVKQPLGGHFYQPPVLSEATDMDVYPRKTETTDIRIDKMRRVEGDYLNYKDFESGDDVRRIVWKVYARNRDLVVRVPERFEPYASHLYFYASFQSAVKGQWSGEGYLSEMLNHYKNRVWTIYDTLASKEWNMRYIPDQQFTVAETADDKERSMRIISNSSWQNDTGLNSYFDPRQGTVLCISSLADIHELEQLLDRCDGSIVVYLVKLSDTFRHFVAWNWLKRIIFLPPKDRLSKLRTGWIFSPMRLQLQRREKEIENLLKKSAVVSTII